MKVLIVEDDPSIRFGLEEVLAAEGYETAVCERGDSVVDKTLAGFAADLIVMDVMLPYVGGFELITEIRQTSGWERVPVIMLTSKSQERDVLRAFDAGVNDYVVKPFRPEEFVARVRRLADAGD